jgi:hypothetical protein
MSEEEKKAIKNLQEVAEKGIDIYEEINVMENEDAIRIVLNLIEKQEKVIDEMFLYIDEFTDIDEVDCEFQQLNNVKCIDDCEKCMKEFFYRKVENNE